MLKNHTLIITSMWLLFCAPLQAKKVAGIPDRPTQIFHNIIGHASYQDQIINNKIIKYGRVKNAPERYNAIKKIVNRFKRPVTVLDLGAAQGYYAFKIAFDRKDAVCVMVEEDKYLLKLCMLNTELDNIIFLQKRVSIDELQHLGTCEHFDIVLALNLIHWSEHRWQQMTDAILSLGQYIIIETPPAGDNAYGKKYLGHIERYLKQKGAQVILKTPRHTGSGLFANMYLIKTNKTSLQQAHWNSSQSKYTYTIEADHQKKTLIKQSKNNQTQTIARTWLPGINLMTFNNLNGIFPLPNTIASGLKNKSTNLSNMIVQGKGIKEIR